MYKKTVLPNKIRVVSHSMKGYDSVSLGLWFGVGGRYESDDVKGASHFLEHIVFKGSRRFSGNQIKKQIEGIGGSLNAFTAQESTCYFARIPSRFLENTLDVLCDMVFHPLIPSQEVERERMVILEEIKMYKDLPQHHVLEILEGLLWPNHPLGRSLPGTLRSVTGLSRDKLRRFQRTCYVPNNLVVAAAGRLNHETCVGHIRSRLSKKRTGQVPRFLPCKEHGDGAKMKTCRRAIEQMHMALGMQGLPYGHPQRYALALLNVILGANMSSRLFNEVREKRGLAYSIGSSVKSLSDTGVFLIRAGVDNTKLVETMGVIFHELRRIRRNYATDSELKRAKDYLTGQLLLDLEDTLDHMFWIGERVVAMDSTRTLGEIMNKINAVSPADVRQAARDVLKEERYRLSVVGPVKKKQERRLREILGIRS